ncbi:MAG TPA: TSUP family transporter [Candidatus Corynebacterium avicola]|uniref:Probable membrane transporter protein n=1 Tax=Candidatus Corynebacterium avicola TaxID=2838527 RepID=A0A9D1UMU7_9CORY|nr:TSUP family transporter [Candidatus Corynebacterium avicola]
MLVLMVAALVAGAIDAIIGGGGLVLIPMILAVAPGMPTQVALGTNKLTAMFGTASAGLRMIRTVSVDWKLVRVAAPLAALCSAGGAGLATAVNNDVLRPIVVVLMLVIGIYVALRPQFGRSSDSAGGGRGDGSGADPVSTRRYLIALALAGVIGAYDGFFGPGTGMFLIMVFTSVMSRSLIQSLATTKLVNTATNLGGLVVFALGGHVLWILGVLLAIFNVIGAQAGARLVLNRGTGFIRIALLVLIVVMSTKLVIDMVSGSSS